MIPTTTSAKANVPSTRYTPFSRSIGKAKAKPISPVTRIDAGIVTYSGIPISADSQAAE